MRRNYEEKNLTKTGVEPSTLDFKYFVPHLTKNVRVWTDKLLQEGEKKNLLIKFHKGNKKTMGNLITRRLNVWVISIA